MTDEELYFWDISGYLIVRSVLSGQEIEAGNAAIDFCQDEIPKREERWGSKGHKALAGSSWMEMHGLLQLDPPHCDPFRRMLVHPQIISRLNVMMGKGFRLDHGPLIIAAHKGTEGLTLHGSGEPHSPVVGYHQQNGRSYCNGVTVQYQLADVNAGDGGFICVPGSHKARYRMPEGIRTLEDDQGLVLQPPTEAGDAIFFMDGAQTHGTHPWTADHMRRSILIKYSGKNAIRGAPDRALFDPEAWWDASDLEEMSDLEREVMHGPGVHIGDRIKGLIVDEEGRVTIAE